MFIRVIKAPNIPKRELSIYQERSGKSPQEGGYKKPKVEKEERFKLGTEGGSKREFEAEGKVAPREGEFGKKIEMR